MNTRMLFSVHGLVFLCLGVVAFGATENPHGELAWDCAKCHSTESWHKLAVDAEFKHRETGFQLDGAHKSVPCMSCHRELSFSHVGTACADCHADHHEGQLGKDCQDCHISRDWQPMTQLLQQHAERGFPLTGVHAAVDCEACHQSGDRVEYVGTPTACEVCHRRDLDRAIDPDHSSLAFATDCERCHHAALGSWNRSTYQHPQSFPLTGAHSIVSCGGCHAESFAGTRTDCFGCHQSDFQNAGDPNHVAGGFSTNCAACHSTFAWEPAEFDHNQTAFPLTGRHVTIDCSPCHATGYSGTPGDCYSCHQEDYFGTGDPDHVASQFPTTCEMCHTTSGWEPAEIDHNQTAFPLTGQHSTAACAACHATSYSGTPTECFACHEADYNATSDPNHVAANFPTGCESCHSTSGWTPADWDHDAQYFPIYSGAHQGRWGDCVECHTIPSDYSAFDCTACHAHNQTDTDDHHSQVQGYQYLSSACYSCHPTGRS